jgi:hypothetical protein
MPKFLPLLRQKATITETPFSSFETRPLVINVHSFLPQRSNFWTLLLVTVETVSLIPVATIFTLSRSPFCHEVFLSPPPYSVHGSQ